jgi:hypothetical protein
MKEMITGCVSRRPGSPVLITEALNDAVATLFVRWEALKVNDTAHFRALVVQAVYWKVTAQRRANRRLAEALTDASPAPDSGANRDTQEQLEAAIEALAENELEGCGQSTPSNEVPTPLADVVKARHLIGAAPGGEVVAIPTFEAVGQMLGITAATACKRYWKALEWLHEHFPQLLPALPERKKAGRRRGSGGPT